MPTAHAKSANTDSLHLRMTNRFTSLICSKLQCSIFKFYASIIEIFDGELTESMSVPLRDGFN